MDSGVLEHPQIATRLHLVKAEAILHAVAVRVVVRVDSFQFVAH